MSKCCPCGGIPRGSAPPAFVIMKSDLKPKKDFKDYAPKLVTRNLKDFQPQTGYDIYEAWNTSEFCSKCPSDIALSFPLRQINFFGYQLYLNVVSRKWSQYCQCKNCDPPPFKGGQCPMLYKVEIDGKNVSVYYPGVEYDRNFTIAYVYGPIGKIELTQPFQGSPIDTCYTYISITCHGAYGAIAHFPPAFRDPRIVDLGVASLHPTRITKITITPYYEDQIDSCGDPAPTTPPPPPPNFDYGANGIFPPPPVISPPPPPPPPACECKPTIAFRDRIVKVPVDRIIKVPVDRIVKVPVDRIIKVPVDRIVKIPIPCPPEKPCKCPEPETINIPIFDRCENGTPQFRTLSLTVPKGAGVGIQQTFRTIAANYKCEDDVKFVEISVTVFDHCNGDRPKFREEKVSVIQGTEAQVFKQFFELAQIRAKEECSQCDEIAAVPEWWQVRAGADRPQLIVQYAQMLTPPGFTPAKYGPPNHIITIPHYSVPADQTTREAFPPYQKGQAMSVLTLKDNSKLIVNCNSQRTAQILTDQLQSTIDSSQMNGAALSIGIRKGQALKTVVVYPRIVKYFANGQKDLKPTWIKYFKNEDQRPAIAATGCAT